jgi:putative NADH-flavin reductase
MRITVFGAAGRVGKLLVEEALGRGHEVTAFGRAVDSRLPLKHPSLIKLPGDLLQASEVEAAVAGREAVLTAHGSARGGWPDNSENAIRNVIAAMEKEGARRLISVSAAGMEHRLGGFLFWGVFQPLVLRKAYADLRRMEAAIEASALDWTIVRPSGLTEGPRVGDYDAAPEERLKTFRISRADVAHFMLEELEAGRWIRQKPALAYPQ